MLRSRLFRPLRHIHLSPVQVAPRFVGELSQFLNAKPRQDPTPFVLAKLKLEYSNGIVPFEAYSSLFDWLAEHNQRHVAIQIFKTMLQEGYQPLAGTEAKFIAMLLENWDPDDKTMLIGLAERLVTLAEDASFTEKDMYGLLHVSRVQALDKRIALIAVDAFRRARGDLDKYLPPLDLLPSIVEVTVNQGSVEEAFRLLEKAGAAVKAETSQLAPESTVNQDSVEDTAKESQPVIASPELSIRRALTGGFEFKDLSATHRSLLVAYRALLKTLSHTDLWKSNSDIVKRAFKGLKAAGVRPDTAFLNLAMQHAIANKCFTLVSPTYARMLGNADQAPDTQTYAVAFSMWEAFTPEKPDHPSFSTVRPRALFRNLLLAIAPTARRPAVQPTTPLRGRKSIALTEDLFLGILRAYLHQRDYAGAYVALGYMMSGISVRSWHTLYYTFVRHFMHRVFKQPPGPYGVARWAEGFLGSPLRRGQQHRSGTIGMTGMAGTVGGPQGQKMHRPVGSVRLPLDSRTTNYLLAAIARAQWRVTDPLYPVDEGDMPRDATHLFFVTPSTPTPEPGRPSHTFAYSVPSMFMMEQIAPPHLPAGFTWSLVPLQRLLLRALYADAVFAYRREGRNAANAHDRPLELPNGAMQDCVVWVEGRLEEAHKEMLPLPEHRDVVPVGFPE